jgi:hypothetical protein
MNTTSRFLAASLSIVAIATWTPANACTERSRSYQQTDLAHELLRAAGPRLSAGFAWAGIGAGLGGTLAGSVTKLLGGEFEDGFATGAALGTAAGFATGLIYDIEAAAPVEAQESLSRGHSHPKNL